MHLGSIAMIERGVMDGRYQIGVIPEHRPSNSLDYNPLFDEVMCLYAGQGHPWFIGSDEARSWDALKTQALAGLGYHSPNMELTHTRRLERSATASDQEAVALLVMSGAYVGFLPDHYAHSFVQAGQMRAVDPDVLNYRCHFSCIRRHGYAMPRVAQAFADCLIQAHAGADVTA
jgi:DNA-binding transcriptional LysR family regulator